MLIAEFARVTGLPRDTVRYYEKLSLLQPATHKGTGNSYRHYGAEDVERAALIRMAQSFGFTLREIKTLLSSWESGALTVEEQIAIMQDKIEQIRARVAQLNAVRRYFEAKIRWIEGGAKGKPPSTKLPHRI